MNMTNNGGTPARRFPGGIRQNGYIVNNLEQSIESWRALDVGPWIVLPTMVQAMNYRGVAVEPEITIAFANCGELQIEVVQQLNDSPSIYREFLDTAAAVKPARPPPIIVMRLGAVGIRCTPESRSARIQGRSFVTARRNRLPQCDTTPRTIFSYSDRAQRAQSEYEKWDGKVGWKSGMEKWDGKVDYWGGAWRGQGIVCSAIRARRKQMSSRYRSAMHCNPTGMPLLWSPAGMLIAGRFTRLASIA